MSAWMFVSKVLEEALINIVMFEVQPYATVRYLKLKALQPREMYQDMKTMKIYLAGALMDVGIKVTKLDKEYATQQILLKKI